MPLPVGARSSACSPPEIRAQPRAWLGVTAYPLRHRIVIATALPGSPAEAAGLRSGDFVVAVDGESLADRPAFFHALWARRSGEPIALRILRDERIVEVEVQAGSIEAYFRAD